MESINIATSTSLTSHVMAMTSIGSTGSTKLSHVYQAHVAHIKSHSALAPNRFQLRSEKAKEIVQASGEALKKHIKHHYGTPPVTARFRALGSGSTAWGRHLKNLCKNFGKEAFPVPGHQDIYVAEVAHTTKNTRSILALRLRFNGEQEAISSVAVPSAIEKSAAEQNLLTPPCQNTCRLNRTKNPGAMKEERIGTIRTGIQGQGSSTAAAA